MSGLYEVSDLIPMATIGNQQNIVIRRALCPYPTSRNNAPPRPNQPERLVSTPQLTDVPHAGCMGPEKISFQVEIIIGSFTVSALRQGHLLAGKYEGGWRYLRNLDS